MYQIVFPKHPNNLFDVSVHRHYKGALQIVVETNLPAYIISTITGEVVYEHK